MKAKRVHTALLAAACIFVPMASAASITYTFDTPSNAADGDGNLAAEVDFTLTDAGKLYIAITNNVINPGAAGQLVSDLGFVLSNGSTILTSAGTLNNAISGTVGSSSNVTILDGSFNATTTTATPSTWQFAHNGSGNKECTVVSTCYFLNDLTGGKPANMIIGPGPYTNANPSITGHQPSLTGTVVFEVDGITGLTSATTVSDINLSFGTSGGEGNSILQTCTAGVDCGGGVQSVSPEPISLVLTGSGLLLLGVFRRKILPKR